MSSTSITSQQGVERQEQVGRWAPHRGWSVGVRLLVALLPVVAGLLVGQLVADLLGAPAGWAAATLWWAAILSATIATVVVVEHGARRLLPLSMLLRLSLVFPDRAPNRFRVALRASTVRRAERALEGIEEATDANSHAEAALALVAALHAHDRRTRGHSERVRALTVMVGRELGLEADALHRLEWAGLLHDIGKLRVPAAILNKGGPPDDEEWSVLRRHPGDGGVFMAPLAAWLGEWVHGVDQHHECHDGSGYPRGLAGAEIALSGRIVAVTDALETMTAARSYKRPMPVAKARAELVACAGTQFDPAVVRAALSLSLPRLVLVLGPVAVLLQVPAVAPAAAAAVDLQGALAAVASTTPRAVASAALVLGALGGGPAATVAGADAEVAGITVGEHADPGSSGAGEVEPEVGPGGTRVEAVADADVVAVAGTARDVRHVDVRSSVAGPGDAPGAGAGRGATAPGAHGPPSSPPSTTPPTTGPPPTRPPTTGPPPTPPTTGAPATPPDPPGLPAAALACLNRGWAALGFPNQGQCLSARLPG